MTTTTIRSEEHTSELQSHRDLHSFPTRRSSDLARRRDDRESGMTMIGAVALVGPQPPAELAHDDDHNTVETIVQVGMERTQRARQLPHQVGQARRLVLVGVPAAHVDGEGTNTLINADD